MAPLNRQDLDFIFQQILIAEAHAAGADPTTLLPNSFAPFGLRTVMDRSTTFPRARASRGKIAVINMMYAHCEGICPTTANLVRVQELLGERVGRDIFMYSIMLLLSRTRCNTHGNTPVCMASSQAGCS